MKVSNTSLIEECVLKNSCFFPPIPSSSNPLLNGHLYYPRPESPDDIDRTLNEENDNKIREYRTDYNECPSNSIPFIPFHIQDHRDKSVVRHTINGLSKWTTLIFPSDC
jgi:hypothetical protein